MSPVHHSPWDDAGRVLHLKPWARGQSPSALPPLESWSTLQPSPLCAATSRLLVRSLGLTRRFSVAGSFTCAAHLSEPLEIEDWPDLS